MADLQKRPMTFLAYVCLSHSASLVELLHSQTFQSHISAPKLELCVGVHPINKRNRSLEILDEAGVTSNSAQQEPLVQNDLSSLNLMFF